MKRYSMWIWLAEKCGAGNSEISGILEGFDSIEAIYDSDFDTYVAAGVSERLAEDLCDKSMDEAVRIINYCQTNRVGILAYDDERYPSSLRAIRNPPAVLYYVGMLPDLNKQLFISMVGTRSMSEYGMRAAYKIAYEVAASGAVVVSGMALGIDGVSAAAAIKAGGKTVAVLGCGIDRVYPKEHTKLKEQIIRHGVMITEFAPGTEPMGKNFPIRNRIISGISAGTVVVDADLGSGAMITAKTAILQGRDIYAVPSNIDSQNSSGTNSLIRDGAQAVLCGYDIIKNYTFTYRAGLNIQRMRDAERHSELDIQAVSAMGVGSRGKSKATFSSRGNEQAKDTRKADGKGNTHPKDTMTRDVATDGSNNTEALPQNAYMAVLEDKPSKQKSMGDRSREALESLNEKQRLVFDEMPLDRAITVDYLTKTGLKLGEVMSALTVLEVKGLISSLPGAIYIRK